MCKEKTPTAAVVAVTHGVVTLLWAPRDDRIYEQMRAARAARCREDVPAGVGDARFRRPSQASSPNSRGVSGLVFPDHRACSSQTAVAAKARRSPKATATTRPRVVRNVQGRIYGWPLRDAPRGFRPPRTVMDRYRLSRASPPIASPRRHVHAGKRAPERIEGPEPRRAIGDSLGAAGIRRKRSRSDNAVWSRAVYGRPITPPATLSRHTMHEYGKPRSASLTQGRMEWFEAPVGLERDQDDSSNFVKSRYPTAPSSQDESFELLTALSDVAGGPHDSPPDELRIMKWTLLRETYLTRLHDVVSAGTIPAETTSGNGGVDTLSNARARQNMFRLLTELLAVLRRITVEIVEAIERWRGWDIDKPFIWGSSNYLAKAASDISFLGRVPGLEQYLGVTVANNPLLCHVDLEGRPASFSNIRAGVDRRRTNGSLFDEFPLSGSVSFGVSPDRIKAAAAVLYREIFRRTGSGRRNSSFRTPTRLSQSGGRRSNWPGPPACLEPASTQTALPSLQNDTSHGPGSYPPDVKRLDDQVEIVFHGYQLEEERRSDDPSVVPRRVSRPDDRHSTTSASKPLVDVRDGPERPAECQAVLSEPTREQVPSEGEATLSVSTTMNCPDSDDRMPGGTGRRGSSFVAIFNKRDGVHSDLKGAGSDRSPSESMGGKKSGTKRGDVSTGESTIDAIPFDVGEECHTLCGAAYEDYTQTLCADQGTLNNKQLQQSDVQTKNKGDDHDECAERRTVKNKQRQQSDVPTKGKGDGHNECAEYCTMKIKQREQSDVQIRDKDEDHEECAEHRTVKNKQRQQSHVQTRGKDDEGDECVSHEIMENEQRQQSDVQTKDKHDDGEECVDHGTAKNKQRKQLDMRTKDKGDDHDECAEPRTTKKRQRQECDVHKKDKGDDHDKCAEHSTVKNKQRQRSLVRTMEKCDDGDECADHGTVENKQRQQSHVRTKDRGDDHGECANYDTVTKKQRQQPDVQTKGTDDDHDECADHGTVENMQRQQSDAQTKNKGDGHDECADHDTVTKKQRRQPDVQKKGRDDDDHECADHGTVENKQRQQSDVQTKDKDSDGEECSHHCTVKDQQHQQSDVRTKDKGDDDHECTEHGTMKNKQRKQSDVRTKHTCHDECVEHRTANIKQGLQSDVQAKDKDDDSDECADHGTVENKKRQQSDVRTTDKGDYGDECAERRTAENEQRQHSDVQQKGKDDDGEECADHGRAENKQLQQSDVRTKEKGDDGDECAKHCMVENKQHQHSDVQTNGKDDDGEDCADQGTVEDKQHQESDVQTKDKGDDYGECVEHLTAENRQRQQSDAQTKDKGHDGDERTKYLTAEDKQHLQSDVQTKDKGDDYDECVEHLTVENRQHLQSDVQTKDKDDKGDECAEHFAAENKQRLQSHARTKDKDDDDNECANHGTVENKQRRKSDVRTMDKGDDGDECVGHRTMKNKQRQQSDVQTEDLEDDGEACAEHSTVKNMQRQQSDVRTMDECDDPKECADHGTVKNERCQQSDAQTKNEGDDEGGNESDEEYYASMHRKTPGEMLANAFSAWAETTERRLRYREAKAMIHYCRRGLERGVSALASYRDAQAKYKGDDEDDKSDGEYYASMHRKTPGEMLANAFSAWAETTERRVRYREAKATIHHRRRGLERGLSALVSYRDAQEKYKGDDEDDDESDGEYYASMHRKTPGEILANAFSAWAETTERRLRYREAKATIHHRRRGLERGVSALVSYRDAQAKDKVDDEDDDESDGEYYASMHRKTLGEILANAFSAWAETTERRLRYREAKATTHHRRRGLERGVSALASYREIVIGERMADAFAGEFGLMTRLSVRYAFDALRVQAKGARIAARNRSAMEAICVRLEQIGRARMKHAWDRWLRPTRQSRPRRQDAPTKHETRSGLSATVVSTTSNESEPTKGGHGSRSVIRPQEDSWSEWLGDEGSTSAHGVGDKQTSNHRGAIAQPTTSLAGRGKTKVTGATRTPAGTLHGLGVRIKSFKSFREILEKPKDQLLRSTMSFGSSPANTTTPLDLATAKMATGVVDALQAKPTSTAGALRRRKADAHQPAVAAGSIQHAWKASREQQVVARVAGSVSVIQKSWRMRSRRRRAGSQAVRAWRRRARVRARTVNQALIEAAGEGDLRAVAFLLRPAVGWKAGADANATDDDRATALHAACRGRQTGTKTRSTTDRTPIVFGLGAIGDNAPADAGGDGGERTHADWVGVIRALVEAGASVEAKDVWGFTPILTAAGMAGGHIVTALADLGAEVDISEDGSMKRTPLIVAAQRTNVSAAAALLEYGARVNLPAGDGLTPLHEAVGAGSLAIAEMMVRAGAQVDATSDSAGMTPLHLAVASGQHAASRLLVHAGANVCLPDARGMTPLRLTVEMADAATLALLLSAERRADLSIEDENQATVLHAACRLGLTGIAQLLLESGANPQARDTHGKTPELVALDLGHEECAGLFCQLEVGLFVLQSDKSESVAATSVDEDASEAMILGERHGSGDTDVGRGNAPGVEVGQQDDELNLARGEDGLVVDPECSGGEEEQQYGRLEQGDGEVWTLDTYREYEEEQTLDKVFPEAVDEAPLLPSGALQADPQQVLTMSSAPGGDKAEWSPQQPIDGSDTHWRGSMDQTATLEVERPTAESREHAEAEHIEEGAMVQGGEGGEWVWSSTEGWRRHSGLSEPSQAIVVFEGGGAPPRAEPATAENGVDHDLHHSESFSEMQLYSNENGVGGSLIDESTHGWVQTPDGKCEAEPIVEEGESYDDDVGGGDPENPAYAGGGILTYTPESYEQQGGESGGVDRWGVAAEGEQEQTEPEQIPGGKSESLPLNAAYPSLKRGGSGLHEGGYQGVEASFGSYQTSSRSEGRPDVSVKDGNAREVLRLSRAEEKQYGGYEQQDGVEWIPHTDREYREKQSVEGDFPVAVGEGRLSPGVSEPSQAIVIFEGEGERLPAEPATAENDRDHGLRQSGSYSEMQLYNNENDIVGGSLNDESTHGWVQTPDGNWEAETIDEDGGGSCDDQPGEGDAENPADAGRGVLTYTPENYEFEQGGESGYIDRSGVAAHAEDEQEQTEPGHVPDGKSESLPLNAEYPSLDDGGSGLQEGGYQGVEASFDSYERSSLSEGRPDVSVEEKSAQEIPSSGRAEEDRYGRYEQQDGAVWTRDTGQENGEKKSVQDDFPEAVDRAPRLSSGFLPADHQQVLRISSAGGEDKTERYPHQLIDGSDILLRDSVDQTATLEVARPTVESREHAETEHIEEGAAVQDEEGGEWEWSSTEGWKGHSGVGEPSQAIVVFEGGKPPPPAESATENTVDHGLSQSESRSEIQLYSNENDVVGGSLSNESTHGWVQTPDGNWEAEPAAEEGGGSCDDDPGEGDPENPAVAGSDIITYSRESYEHEQGGESGGVDRWGVAAHAEGEQEQTEPRQGPDGKNESLPLNAEYPSLDDGGSALQAGAYQDVETSFGSHERSSLSEGRLDVSAEEGNAQETLAEVWRGGRGDDDADQWEPDEHEDNEGGEEGEQSTALDTEPVLHNGSDGGKGTSRRGTVGWSSIAATLRAKNAWMSIVDRESGSVYYQNQSSGATQWEPPAEDGVVVVPEYTYGDGASIQ